MREGNDDPRQRPRGKAPIKALEDRRAGPHVLPHFTISSSVLRMLAQFRTLNTAPRVPPSYRNIRVTTSRSTTSSRAGSHVRCDLSGMRRSVSCPRVCCSPGRRRRLQQVTQPLPRGLGSWWLTGQPVPAASTRRDHSRPAWPHVRLPSIPRSNQARMRHPGSNGLNRRARRSAPTQESRERGR